jgi:hypothetical protein
MLMHPELFTDAYMDPSMDIDDGAVISIATADEVARFARTKKAKDGPSADDFRLDLDADRSLTSPWNKRAGMIFADSFLASCEYSCQDAALIRKTFATHLKTIRSRYLDSLDDDKEPSQEDHDAVKLKARVARRRGVSAISLYSLCQSLMLMHSSF